MSGITEESQGSSEVRTVNDRTPASQSMVDQAAVCRALWGGTDAMRKAGKKYLPQEPKEETGAYDSRLSRSVLYNAYKRAVLSLRGRPFRDGMSLGENVPKEVEEWAQDVDLSGRSLSVFFRDTFTDALNAGLCHVMVDYPPFKTKDSGDIVGETLGDEIEANKRPWLVQVPMETILGWESERRGGVRRLTMIRLREFATIKVGKWGEKTITQVKVIYAGGTSRNPMGFGRFEIWRAGGKNFDDWKKATVVKFGMTSFIDIPLHTVYTNQTAYMMGAPPLLDMAHNNVRHWQASSDYAHIVHVTNFPILYLAGDLRGQGDDEDDPIQDEGDTSMGPNMLIQGKVGTSLTFVEPTGKAIESGEKYIQGLEDHMAMMGLDLLVPKVGGPETATGRKIDFSESISDLQAMTEGMVSVASEVIRQMVEVSNVREMPREGEKLVEAGSNLGLSLKDPDDLEALKFARTNRDISRIQYLRELKRRRVLEADYDADEDESLLDEESPMMGDGATGPDLEGFENSQEQLNRNKNAA